jgi:diketogulonate reductase-like aldo/keto reductase
LTAYSPLVNPFYVVIGGVQSSNIMVKRLGSNDTPLKEEKIITEIAEKHNCQSAQVLLNWGIQRGYVVLTKVRISRNKNLSLLILTNLSI